jgi:hypothetical protein
MLQRLYAGWPSLKIAAVALLLLGMTGFGAGVVRQAAGGEPPALKEPDEKKEPTARKRLDIAKLPIGPRMMLAVNVNQEEKLVILEESLTDLQNPGKPHDYIEFSQFSLKEGRAFWADGTPLAEKDIWKHLPKDLSETSRTVLHSPDDRGLNPQYRRVLKPDTIILVGEAVFRGVGEPRGAAPRGKDGSKKSRRAPRRDGIRTSSAG